MKPATRLLVLLPQLPDDPASGASRTVTSVAALMAAAGFGVELIATTANEGQRPVSLLEALAQFGVTAAASGGYARFERRGVRFTLVDAGDTGIRASMQAVAPMYDSLVDEALERFRPHVALTYGGSRLEVERQRRLRGAGVKVVFGLYNMRYFTPGFFDHVTAVLTPSEFLSARYREVIGLESTPLPGPLWPEDVLAELRRPSHVTIVNPTLDKGLMVFAAIAKLLEKQLPSVPIDIFTTRDSAHSMRQAAFLAGADLGRPGVTVHSGGCSPRQIYENARVLIVPSLFEDPAPRVVAEAFANGVVPLGSDRGGIPEMCNEAGFVIPIPRSVQQASFDEVSSDIAQPWVARIRALVQEEAPWQQAVARGHAAGAAYLPPNTTRRYAEYFEKLVHVG